MGRPNGSASKVEGINVFVRVRPLSLEEEVLNQEVVDVSEGGTCLSVRPPEEPHKSLRCTYDRVFDPTSTQEDVFSALIPSLKTVLEGYNACVLAYGQTGAGKTYTLLGPGGGTGLPDDHAKWGVVPRAVQLLFNGLSAAVQEDPTFSYSVTCSFLQIYNEDLADLLQSGGQGASLQIREEAPSGHRGGTWGRGRRRRTGPRPGALQEGGRGRVYVNGLSSFRVGGAEDVLRYIAMGAANRRVRATQYNEVSSRSHTVMQLTVESESTGGSEGGGGEGEEGGGVDEAKGRGTGSHVTYRQSKLSLVDLAGSEKMDTSTSISRVHFNELRCINRSLSALGNVISAVADRQRAHVPYRDSKLTRLLQDSLGGNTRTTVIACVAASGLQINETVSTLQFADRAKKVMVRLRPNEVVDDRVLLARARAEIARLKQLLSQALGKIMLAGEVTLEAAKAVPASTESPPPNDSPGLGGENPTDSGAIKDKDDFSKEAAGPTAAPTQPAPTNSGVVIALRKQAASLMAENEKLLEHNDRLRRDIQRLVAEGRRKRSRSRQGRGRSRCLPILCHSAKSRRTGDAGSYPCNAISTTMLQRPGTGRTAVSGSASPPAAPRFHRHQFDESDEDSGPAVEEEGPGFSVGELREILSPQAGERHHEGDVEGHKGGEWDRGEGEHSWERELEEEEGPESRIAELRALMEGTMEGQDHDGKVVGVEDLQLAEDLMFAAHREERRRLREERKHLSSTRQEREALERQLIELTQSLAVESTGGKGAADDDPDFGPQPCSTRSAESTEKRAQRGESEGRGQGPEQEEEGPRSSKLVPDSNQSGATFTAPVIPSTAAGGLLLLTEAGKTSSEGHRTQGIEGVGGWGKVIPGIGGVGTGGPTPPPCPHSPPANSSGQREHVMSVRSKERVPLSCSPTSCRPVSTGASPGVHRLWGGGDSRSPARGNLRPEEAWGERQGKGGGQKGSGWVKAGGWGTGRGGKKKAAKKLRLLQASYPLPGGGSKDGQRKGLHRSSKGEQNCSNISDDRGMARVKAATATEGGGGGGGNKGGKIRQGSSTPELAYGLQDLGLRLKIYSFRYDCDYECQVVSYDARRRMHQCHYDLTGDRQWHDLSNKHCQVISQNGTIRETESAPLAIGNTGDHVGSCSSTSSGYHQVDRGLSLSISQHSSNKVAGVDAASAAAAAAGMSLLARHQQHHHSHNRIGNTDGGGRGKG